MILFISVSFSSIYISTHRNTILLYANPLIVNSRVCLVLYTLSGYHAISRRLLSMMAHRKITFISMFLYFSLITFSMPQRTMLIKRMPKPFTLEARHMGLECYRQSKDARERSMVKYFSILFKA